MSGEAVAVMRSWVVGPYTVTMTIPKPKQGEVINACVEWAPHEPSGLSTEEWRQYRLGRNTALAEMADELGISVAVLEI